MRLLSCCLPPRAHGVFCRNYWTLGTTGMKPCGSGNSPLRHSYLHHICQSPVPISTNTLPGNSSCCYFISDVIKVTHYLNVACGVPVTNTSIHFIVVWSRHQRRSEARDNISSILAFRIARGRTCNNTCAHVALNL